MNRTILSWAALGLVGCVEVSDPCSVTSDDDGLTIDCPDGTSATVPSGQDGADGEDGKEGQDGDDGQAGDDGATPLVVVETEEPGENCAYGGYRVLLGFDESGDGELAPSEVDETLYVCNPAPPTGDPALIEVDPASTSECGYGGYVVTTGFDTNEDGEIDDVLDEVVVCNTTGTSALVSLAEESAGDNCPEGGVAITTGWDTTGDGQIDQDAQTTYLCHGDEPPSPAELAQGFWSLDQVDGPASVCDGAGPIAPPEGDWVAFERDGDGYVLSDVESGGDLVPITNCQVFGDLLACEPYVAMEDGDWTREGHITGVVVDSGTLDVTFEVISTCDGTDCPDPPECIDAYQVDATHVPGMAIEGGSHEITSVDEPTDICAFADDYAPTLGQPVTIEIEDDRYTFQGHDDQGPDGPAIRCDLSGPWLICEPVQEGFGDVTLAFEVDGTFDNGELLQLTAVFTTTCDGPSCDDMGLPPSCTDTYELTVEHQGDLEPVPGRWAYGETEVVSECIQFDAIAPNEEQWPWVELSWDIWEGHGPGAPESPLFGQCDAVGQALVCDETPTFADFWKIRLVSPGLMAWSGEAEPEPDCSGTFTQWVYLDPVEALQLGNWEVAATQDDGDCPFSPPEEGASFQVGAGDPYEISFPDTADVVCDLVDSHLACEDPWQDEIDDADGDTWQRVLSFEGAAWDPEAMRLRATGTATCLTGDCPVTTCSEDFVLELEADSNPPPE